MLIKDIQIMLLKITFPCNAKSNYARNERAIQKEKNEGSAVKGIQIL